MERSWTSLCLCLMISVTTLAIVTLMPVKLLLYLPFLIFLVLILTVIIITIWLASESFWEPQQSASKGFLHTFWPGPGLELSISWSASWSLSSLPWSRGLSSSPTVARAPDPPPSTGTYQRESSEQHVVQLQHKHANLGVHQGLHNSPSRGGYGDAHLGPHLGQGQGHETPQLHQGNSSGANGNFGMIPDEQPDFPYKKRVIFITPNQNLTSKTLRISFTNWQLVLAESCFIPGSRTSTWGTKSLK